jgi:hypothetical protein
MRVGVLAMRGFGGARHVPGLYLAYPNHRDLNHGSFA